MAFRTLPRRITGRIGTLPVEPSRPTQLPPKPNAEDTPYRSEIHVAPTDSADGNGYAKGEPIPEIEFRRQVTEGIIPEHVEPLIARLPCPKCKGTGKRGRGGRNYANHKFNCACVACIPCKDCGGVGRIEVA